MINCIKIAENPVLEKFLEQPIQYFKKYLQIQELQNAMIAGGSIESLIYNRKLNDIDIYTNSISQYNKTVDNLSKKYPDKTLLTENAFNIKSGILGDDEIDLIYTSDYKDTLENFDYSVCKIGITSSEVFYHPNSIEDIKNKIIRIEQTGTIDKYTFLDRIFKYVEKEYVFPKPELDKINARIIDMNINDFIKTKYNKGKYNKKQKCVYSIYASTSNSAIINI